MNSDPELKDLLTAFNATCFGEGDINAGTNLLVVKAIIREAVEHIPFDVLIDGEAVGDTLHAFDLLEVKGNDLRQRRYLDRFAGLIMATEKQRG